MFPRTPTGKWSSGNTRNSRGSWTAYAKSAMPGSRCGRRSAAAIAPSLVLPSSPTAPNCECQLRLDLFAALAERDLRIHLASAAVERHGNGVPGPLVVQHQAEIELAGSFLAIDCNDHVASNENSAHPEQGGVVSSAQAGFVRRPAARG